MDVFLSWSGKRSRQLAECLREWLPNVIHGLEPFLSEEIEKGERWEGSLRERLQKSTFGILCLTRDNLGSQSILFEAGALSNSLGQRVCPFLIGVEVTELTWPLRSFQHCTPEKRSVQALVLSIGKTVPGYKRRKQLLETAFEKWWPDLELKLQRIITDDASNTSNKFTPLIAASARRLAVEQAIEKLAQPPPLRGHQYLRNDIIMPDGDVRIIEMYVGVKANGGIVSESPIVLHSRSGRQESFKCESLTPGQRINWEWVDKDADSAKGKLVFDPPLQESTPVDFRLDRYIINAISFTKTERRELTQGADIDESVAFRSHNLWNRSTLQIHFPKYRFPNQHQIRAMALDANGNVVVSETEEALKSLQPWPDTQNLILDVQHPLPGVKYKVVWELPDAENTEFNEIEQGFVDEITKRLLFARELNKVAGLLGPILMDVRNRVIGQSTKDVTITLYTYDRLKGGLVCVSTLDADRIESRWRDYFFKPGRGVVGTVFRRRSVVVYDRQTSCDGHDIYEVVRGEDERARPETILCIPIFYKEHHDRALAILSIEARFKNSELLALSSDPQFASRIQAEFKDWYETVLGPAVGSIPANIFWLKALSTSSGSTI